MLKKHARGKRKRLSFIYLFKCQKADDKIYNFSKIVKSKLYHIENTKTGGQTVQI